MNILKVLTEKRRIGDLGEDAAARLLKKKGYKILARNLVVGDAEIDIIACDREFTVFIEVKTRKYSEERVGESRPASAVTAEKQRRIIKAARGYLAYNPSPRRVRFDVIEVYYEERDGKLRVHSTEHLEGTFNISSCRK